MRKRSRSVAPRWSTAAADIRRECSPIQVSSRDGSHHDFGDWRLFADDTARRLPFGRCLSAVD